MTMRSRGAIILCAALLPAGCSSKSPADPGLAVPRHLLIVTIDTLRADRLGCYGNRTVATPNLDRLAKEGAMALQATAHVPLTRPSHISLFTGRYPAEHGIRDNISPSFVSPTIPTLSELLHRAGFHTAAFVSSIVLSRQSGLDRGFDTYGDRFKSEANDALFLNTIQKRGDDTTSDAIKWMREQKASPADRMAVWVHLYDPHDPYDPPEPYATQYAGRPYDGEVAWSDELIGRLLAALAELRIIDDTLVVVTSDHGEGLGQHEEAGHGFFVYETTLHVPLLVRGPGIPAGTTLNGVVRTIDLFPTTLDLLGVSRPDRLVVSGRSFATALRGRGAVTDQSSYAESLVPLIHFGWSDLRAIRDGRWKYILAPRPELYDLQQDPGELTNLADAQPGRARALRVALEAQLKDEQRVARDRPSGEAVPPELLEKLGALGYVSPGAPAAGSPSAGADPKDKVGEFKAINRLMREGLTALHDHDYAGSVDRFGRLRARGLDSFEINFYFGRALAGLGKHREAARRFESAISRLPSYSPSYLALADEHVSLGDLKGATAVLRRGQQASPKDPQLYEREAEIWRRLRNPREAIRAYEAMLLLMPKDGLVRVRLGEFYRDLGDTPRAVAYLREGVTLDPTEASYWNSLGMVLGGSGDMTGAESAFREATARNGREAQYAYNLGLALQRQGRARDAAEYFRRTIELNPKFQAAKERLNKAGAR